MVPGEPGIRADEWIPKTLSMEIANFWHEASKFSTRGQGARDQEERDHLRHR